jgi:pyrroloquinoline quinone biosynthesis protein B
MHKTLYYLLFILILACGQEKATETSKKVSNVLSKEMNSGQVTLNILGTIQDAGSPQLACNKDCCRRLFENPDPSRLVVSLGLIDHLAQKQYLFEATPDLPRQIEALHKISGQETLLDGIFLTHAHIGHYTGLMYLGKESIDAQKIPVYAMPRMKAFLTKNGPWSQLLLGENIEIEDLKAEESVRLTKNLVVTPFIVPHRDEFSETVGYHIEGPRKSALFIPDIDKWEKWEKDIVAEIKKVDYAFLDATFYNGEEINNRDISQIPHPFIIESMEKFSTLSTKEKEKIIFIHFNHTNPLLNEHGKASEYVRAQGYRIGQLGDHFIL